MVKRKLEILEIYSGEIIDMNNVKIKKEKIIPSDRRQFHYE